MNISIDSYYYPCNICLSKKNLEKFWAYGAGTRVCNNIGCDIRYLQDKGLYYCKNKENI